MTPPRRSRGLDDEIYARRRRKRRRVERKHTRRRAVVLAIVAVLALLFVVAGAAVTGVATFGSSCDLNSLQQVEIGSNTFIYAADNSRLGVIPAERNRQPVSFNRMSDWMPKATVAIEDRRFYQHDGTAPRVLALDPPSFAAPACVDLVVEPAAPARRRHAKIPRSRRRACARRRSSCSNFSAAASLSVHARSVRVGDPSREETKTSSRSPGTSVRRSSTS